MLVPIDNFISRATERFVTGGAMVGDEATPYLAMVMSICRATLTTHAQDLPDQEQHGACKLLESLLHNCHGRIDAQMPEVLSLALMRLEALLAAEEGLKKDGTVHSMVTLLYNVLSSALHYNAALALQVLQHRHQAGWHATLHAWMQHLTTCPKLRLHDLKCGVLAVSSLLALPPAQAPEVISRNPLMLVQSGVKLLQAMEKKREADKSDEAAALGTDAADADDDDDDELDDDEDGGSDSGGGLGSALKLYGGMGGAMASDFFDDFDDDDDLEDEEMYSTPLDAIDELVSFTDAVQAACAASPSLLAMAGLAPAQGGAASQLSAEDAATLHTVLAAGVAKKAQAAAEILG